MRAIETKIIDWVKTHESGEFRPSMRDSVKGNGNGKYFFRLWDSLIFVKTSDAVYFSFCGYGTVTTKSRINAFLSAFSTGYVRQKNYAMFYNDVELSTNKIYRVADGKIKQIDFDEFYKSI
jgi:hypothetical protein